MKTTVEISDSLLNDARKLASAEGTTVRALVEEGLRAVLAARRHATVFHLRKVVFNGKGVQPGAESWEQIRNLAYQGRGT